jgi:hypothetical protein
MRPEINRPRYEVFAILAFLFHFHTMTGIFALFYIDACFRLFPDLNAQLKKYVSPVWLENRMIIMQCLVPTCSHCAAAPKQSLKQSKMYIIFLARRS